MAKVGRKNKFNDETIELFFKSLRNCGINKIAASASGISQQTLYVWIRAGKKQAKGKYRDFVNKIEQTRSEYLISCVAGIRKAGHGVGIAETIKRYYPDGTLKEEITKTGPSNWTALAWIAERTDPEHFGRQQTTMIKQEVDHGKDNGIKQTIIEMVQHTVGQRAEASPVMGLPEAFLCGSGGATKLQDGAGETSLGVKSGDSDTGVG